MSTEMETAAIVAIVCEMRLRRVAIWVSRSGTN